MLMLQTLRPSKLVLNENSISRMARLKNVIKSYVPEMEPLRNLIEIRDNDAKTMCDYETFDKILLDVPCTNDRHSVNVDDNNYFKSSRVKERIALPKEQCDIVSILYRCIMIISSDSPIAHQWYQVFEAWRNPGLQYVFTISDTK